MTRRMRMTTPSLLTATELAVLSFPDKSVELIRGRVLRRSPRGHRPDRRVGYGQLRLIADREPARELTIAEPDSSGRLTIEVRLHH